MVFQPEYSIIAVHQAVRPSRVSAPWEMSRSLLQIAPAAVVMAEQAASGDHHGLRRGWQLFATALSFAVFGLGGLCFAGFVAPVLNLTCRPARRRRAARWFLHRGFGLFVGLMRGMGLIRYQGENLDRLREPGQIIIANHPSLIDVVFLISFLPGADCVVKEELLRNPFTRGALRAAGYLSNDSSETLLDVGVDRLRAGHSVILFPEGTRSVPDQPLHFQRGCANLALYAGAPIRPVEIRCVPPGLTKAQPWYRIPPRRLEFFFRVHPPIFPGNFQKGAARATAARQLTRHLEHCYERWLADSA